jgi:hypothetical protein
MRIIGIFASVVVLVLSLLVWASLSGPAAAFNLAPLGLDMSLPAVALPAIGLAAGLALGVAAVLVGRATRGGRAGTAADGPPSAASGPVEAGEAEGPVRIPSDRVTIVLGIAFAGIVALLYVAVAQEQIKALPAALVLICGTLTLLAGSYALDGLVRGDAIEISSHWGGLGGGLGGWRLSPISTLLLLALVFLGATIAAGIERAQLPGGSANESTSNTTANAARETPPGARLGSPAAGAQIPAGRGAPGGNETASNGSATTNLAGTR